MNSLQGNQGGRIPEISSPIKYILCGICENKKNIKSVVAMTECGCRFHEKCIVDWLELQEDKNIFTRSCFNSCPLAVPLHIGNAKLGADSNECDIDQTNDRIAKSHRYYESPALTACRTGNLELLHYEYNQCHAIIHKHFKSAIDDKSYSLVLMAVKEDQLEIVKFLTTDKCSLVNLPSGIDSALHVAVQKGYLEIVKQLALKSNANLLNSDGKTAMKIALDNNHMDIIKALWKDTDNRRPWVIDTLLDKFNNAFLVNDINVVSTIISMIELEDSAIDELIEDCVGESKLEILKVLIHHKGIENVNSFEIMRAVFETRFNDDMAIWTIDRLDYSMLSDEERNILLLRASKHNNKICSEIFTSKALKDTFLKKPLKHGIFTQFNEKKDIENARLLINNGVEFTFKQLPDSDKENIIYGFLKKEDFDSLNYLFFIAPTLNRTAIFNRFLLMAIETNDLEMVKLLIANGADVDNIDDSSGITYLSYAIQHKGWDIVKHLIEKNADVNLMDKDTMKTPLHNAIDIRNTDIIKLLINKEAYITTMDKDGDTPLDRATETGDTCIIELLNEKHHSCKLLKEDIIQNLHYLKTVCIENDEEYNNTEPDININKFEDAITLFEKLDCTRITKGETEIHDWDIDAEATNHSSISWFNVYYEDKLLCTITEIMSEMRFSGDYSFGCSGKIETSDDLCNQLFYASSL